MNDETNDESLPPEFKGYTKQPIENLADHLKGNILSEEHYHGLYSALASIGLTDDEPIVDKIIKQFEKASMLLTMLEMLTAGGIRLAAISKQGELLFAKGENLPPPHEDDDDDDEEDDLSAPFELKIPKRFDLN